MTEGKSQPTYKRQRFLLSFIHQLKDSVTVTDIQKLIFLHEAKENCGYYDFVPYKFGPYSFLLAEDIDILCKSRFLTKAGSRIRTIGNYPIEEHFFITSERGDNLIKTAYCEDPYYALNSEIIDRLFNKEDAISFREQKKVYSSKNQMLFTIGYEGKSVETFMNTLIRNDIHLLCDVRKNPLSRKFGFSKNMLEHIANGVGIKYVHIPDLGIDSKKRSSLNSEDDYHRLFDDYSKTLPNLKFYLDYLYSLLCSDNRISLMCYEKEPKMCHRHILRDYLVTTYNIGSTDL